MFSLNKINVKMKKRYETPQMIQVSISTKHLVSASTINENIYNDDPQDPGNALTKENSNHSIWDNEW